MKDKGALIVVDVQNDFCPGGALEVRDGDKVVPVINRYIELFSSAGLPIFATRDWHPEKTLHFKGFGGIWPAHCVQNTGGAEFHPELQLPEDAVIFTKGDSYSSDSYSGFDGRDPDGTTLAEALRARGVGHIFVAGLATDYCVRASVLDGLKEGFRVTLLADAVKGVDVKSGDSERAIEEMKEKGADTTTLEELRFDKPSV